MPQTQKFIIIISALVVGTGLGLFLATIISIAPPTDISASEEVKIETASSTQAGTPTAQVESNDASVAQSAGVICTMDARVCSDGTAVGRVGEQCEFAPCPDEVQYEKTTKICTKDQREAEMCAEIYSPVCGAVQVECVTTPCNPVPQTFPNTCSACQEDRVISYTAGECTPS